MLQTIVSFLYTKWTLWEWWMWWRNNISMRQWDWSRSCRGVFSTWSDECTWCLSTILESFWCQDFIPFSPWCIEICLLYIQAGRWRWPRGDSLLEVHLELPNTLFKLTIVYTIDAVMAEKKNINLVTQMWLKVSTSIILLHKLLEFIKVAEIAMVHILGSVEDERTFSNLTFMKNKLRNKLHVIWIFVWGYSARSSSP